MESFKATKYEDTIEPITTVNSFGSATDESLASMAPRASDPPKRSSNPSLRSNTPSVKSLHVLSTKKPPKSPKAGKGGVKKQQDHKAQKEGNKESSKLGRLFTPTGLKDNSDLSPKKKKRVSSPPLLLSTVPATDQLKPKAKPPKTYTSAKFINKVIKYDIQLPSENALLPFEEKLQPEIRGPMTVKHGRKEHLPPIHVAQDAHSDRVLYCFHNGSRLTQEELNEELKEVNSKDAYNWFEEPCSTADPMRDSIYRRRKLSAKRGSTESGGSSQNQGSTANRESEEEERCEVPLIDSLDLGDAFATNGSTTAIEQHLGPSDDGKTLVCEANASSANGGVTNIQDYPLVNIDETDDFEKNGHATNGDKSTIAKESPFATSSEQTTDTGEGGSTNGEDQNTHTPKWSPLRLDDGRERELTMSQKAQEKKELRQSNESHQAPFASDVRDGEVPNEEMNEDELDPFDMTEDEAAEAEANSRDEVNDVIECYSPSVYSDDEEYEML